MNKKIYQSLMIYLNKIHIKFSRISIFIIYFWFGLLKVIGASPANPLVMDLQSKTLPFLNFHQFIIIFGLLEMIIGIIFLIKGLEKVALVIISIHLITTILPLIVLPQIAWQSFMIPTLEGQYILKNIVIFATAIGIAAQTHIRKLGAGL